MSEQKPDQEQRVLARSRPSSVGKIFFVAGTMVIPILAIFVELATRTLTGMYHDPIPTWGHVFLLALVPASFIVGEYYLAHPCAHRRSRWAAAAFILNGYALTISQIYALVYVPFIPMAFVGVLAMGLGLLPLAPFFCVLGGYVQLAALRTPRGVEGMKKRRPALYTVAGCLLGLFALALLEVPPVLSDHAMSDAFSSSPAERESALGRLRLLGAEDSVLVRCYDRTTTRRNTSFLPFSDLGAFGFESGIGRKRFLPFFESSVEKPRDLESYRKLYFRLTGKPFNSVPPPTSWFVPERWQRERMIASEVGSDSVAARVRGVSAHSSSIDVTIDGDDGGAGPGIALIDWTFEFKNATSTAREARAQIVLPEDGLASDLSLWIDGKEEKAAFGPRHTVRKAYRDVAVVRRRDPALLTTCGPDRVLLQCFPIPPGGTMKTRISLCAPLCIRGGRAYLRLPYMAERNFHIPGDFVHNLRAESRRALETGSGERLAEPSSLSGLATWTGSLSDGDLLDPAAGTLGVPAPPVRAGVVYTGRLGDREASMKWVPLEPPSPTSVCVVIDGSRSMGEADINWDALCAALPSTCRLNAVFAGESTSRWKDDFVHNETRRGDELAHWISSRHFAGGCDPVPALSAAWEMIDRESGGLILWLHGAVPVRLSSPDVLKIGSPLFRTVPRSRAIRPMGPSTS